jgi:hypothetical protein
MRGSLNVSGMKTMKIVKPYLFNGDLMKIGKEVINNQILINDNTKN